jgi:DNA-binding NarL/FixJ family response regulator
MPLLSGEETLRRMQEIESDLRVVVISGHADPERIRGMLMLGACAFVRKPWSVGELEQAVREALLGIETAPDSLVS